MANDIFKTLLNLVTNPYVLAGVAGFAGYQYFGKGKGGRQPLYYALGGAAAGFFAGKGVQSYLGFNTAATNGPTATTLPSLNTRTVIPQGVALLPASTGITTGAPAAGTSQDITAGASITSGSNGKSEQPIGNQPLANVLDSYGSFDDGEYGSLTSDKGWSEEDALNNLAEVDTNVVSLGAHIRRGRS